MSCRACRLCRTFPPLCLALPRRRGAEDRGRGGGHLPGAPPSRPQTRCRAPLGGRRCGCGRRAGMRALPEVRPWSRSYPSPGCILPGGVRPARGKPSPVLVGLLGDLPRPQPSPRAGCSGEGDARCSSGLPVEGLGERTQRGGLRGRPRCWCEPGRLHRGDFSGVRAPPVMGFECPDAFGVRHLPGVWSVCLLRGFPKGPGLA